MIPSYSLAPVFGISISEQRKIYFNHRNTLILLLSNTLIVDRAGVVKLAKRMDNAVPHTLEASRMKAFTALTTKAPTENVMKNAQANAEAQNLRDIPGFLLLAGGVPVKVGDQTIGAIGIGGAPSGSIDQQCALDALEAVKAQLSEK
ncbi:GlcG/HbpS family heme-binding protein [Symbiopectobacterium purcellii]|uniref:GlcG/HbpS family heme-binding protein n=1 Tax=Symbiopectobacterium purcellii TaxID=2871826 RepID=UPI003F86F0D5